MTDRNELAERLIGWCTDWNGSQMARETSPRDGIHCDVLLDAATALRTPALPSEEEIARVLYDLDPYEESGEYVDGYLVSPGGALTWQQACAREAEFADGPILMWPITKSAREAARAVLALFARSKGCT